MFYVFSIHIHECPCTFAIIYFLLRGFPIGLDAPKYATLVPWRGRLETIFYPKLIHLAGNGQCLPLIGGVTCLIFSFLHYNAPPVRLRV